MLNSIYETCTEKPPRELPRCENRLKICEENVCRCNYDSVVENILERHRHNQKSPPMVMAMILEENDKRFNLKTCSK